MTGYNSFHESPLASRPLYNFISSPLLRLTLFLLTLVDIVLFSIGVGLAAEYLVRRRGYWDQSIDNYFLERAALGTMFIPFAWLAYLLGHLLMKKPKLHPGFYIGFDLYVALSIAAALSVAVWLSAPLFHEDEHQACPGWPDGRFTSQYAACAEHLLPLIKRLDWAAYILGFVIS